MLESLSPRHVAARKLARIIAQKQMGDQGAQEPKRVQSEAVTQLDSLERLLDQELRRYGLSLE